MKKSNAKKKSTTKPVYHDIKTFTYFLPAPPPRKSGFQEKELDQILFEILKTGHEIIEIQTQSVSLGEGHGGLYIFCLLGSTSIKARGPLKDIHSSFGLDDDYREASIELIHD